MIVKVAHISNVVFRQDGYTVFFCVHCACIPQMASKHQFSRLASYGYAKAGLVSHTPCLATCVASGDVRSAKEEDKGDVGIGVVGRRWRIGIRHHVVCRFKSVQERDRKVYYKKERL